MSYKVEVTTLFKKQSKRLLKKYPSLKTELITLVNQLEDEPTKGKSLGNSCYKNRLAIASKNKGKSGGARVITHVHIIKTTVFLFSIYDKSDQEDITDKDLEIWISSVQ